jgi:hypothetical protein
MRIDGSGYIETTISLALRMESGVDFVAVDMPKANPLTIHILAAIAENEREAISQLCGWPKPEGPGWEIPLAEFH